MTILNYSTEPSWIIGLWVIIALVSGASIIAGLFCETLQDFPKLTASLLIALALGIIGLIFWTPYYNVIQVYADDKFSISAVQDKYNITNQSGYIITLQEKQPIK